VVSGRYEVLRQQEQTLTRELELFARQLEVDDEHLGTVRRPLRPFWRPFLD
jgi:hypothetical protein